MHRLVQGPCSKASSQSYVTQLNPEFWATPTSLRRGEYLWEGFAVENGWLVQMIPFLLNKMVPFSQVTFVTFRGCSVSVIVFESWHMSRCGGDDCILGGE